MVHYYLTRLNIDMLLVHSNTALSLTHILVMSSINYVSLCTILESLIRLLPNVSSATWKVQLIMVFTTYNPWLFSMPFMTPSKLVIQMTTDLPVVKASLLTKILSLEAQINNMLSLNLAQRQDIALRLLLQLNYIGSGCYFMILVSLYPHLLCYSVITLGLLSLHPIHFSCTHETCGGEISLHPWESC